MVDTPCVKHLYASFASFVYYEFGFPSLFLRYNNPEWHKKIQVCFTFQIFGRTQQILLVYMSLCQKFVP